MDRANWYASVGNEVSGKIFWKSLHCGGPKLKERKIKETESKSTGTSVDTHIQFHYVLLLFNNNIVF